MEQDRAGPAPSVDPERRWSRAGIVSGWVIAIAAVVTAAFGVATFVRGGTDPASSSSSASSSAGPATFEPSPLAEPTSTLSTAQCSAADGSPLSCSDPSAFIFFTSPTCGTPALIQHLGLPTAIGVLDIRTLTAGGRCLVGPGDLARGAGATALDLSQRLTSRRNALRVCRNGSTPVSCVKDHDLEFVSDWQENPDAAPSYATCLDRATAYSGRDLADAQGNLRAVVFREKDEPAARFRCAIASRQLLSESDYELGGADLPTTSASAAP